MRMEPSLEAMNKIHVGNETAEVMLIRHSVSGMWSVVWVGPWRATLLAKEYPYLVREYPYIAEQLDLRNPKPLEMFCKLQGRPWGGCIRDYKRHQGEKMNWDEWVKLE